MHVEHLVSRLRALMPSMDRHGAAVPEGPTSNVVVLSSFAEHLDAYAATLDERDRLLLRTLLYWAMTPIERARARGEIGLLTAEEGAFLDTLEAGAD